MKVKEVVVLYEAAEDLDAGRLFYDEREFGIGDYFIDCLLSDLSALKIYAGIHSKHFGYLRMLSKRFPFAIYYDIEDQIARVVAILDMRMNPDTIRKSLNERSS
jgi:hypothetical protein